MGSHENISYTKFPKQSEYVGKEVEVCFNYNTDEILNGIIVRDDVEAPFQMIIHLEDDRFIRSVECQYTFV